MHAHALQLRRALLRSALARPGAAAFGSASAQLQPQAQAQQKTQAQAKREQPRKRTSTRQFNLLGGRREAAAGNGSGTRNANGNANGNGNGYRFSRGKIVPNSAPPKKPAKWWKNMDRTSFRKLLDECMATGKVTSVLRKVRTPDRSIDRSSRPILSSQANDRFLRSTWTSTRSPSRCGPTRSSS